MDFRQFHYFVTAAEELHFARASERLGIAPAALSLQIKALEIRLGVRLFYRTKRRVELTEAGITFLHRARTTLEMAQRAVREAQDTARGEIGRIEMGITGTVMFEPRIPHLLKNFRKAHPGVDLSIHEMPILTQIEAMDSGHLDVAVLRKPIPPNLPEGLEYFPFSSQRLVAVLPTDHPMAVTNTVALSALAGESFLAFPDPEGIGMGQNLLVWCRSAGFEPKIVHRVLEIATMISLISAGFGITLVPEIIGHLKLHGVSYLKLEDTARRSELIVVQRRFERSASVSALLADIRAASIACNLSAPH